MAVSYDSSACIKCGKYHDLVTVYFQKWALLHETGQLFMYEQI